MDDGVAGLYTACICEHTLQETYQAVQKLMTTSIRKAVVQTFLAYRKIHMVTGVHPTYSNIACVHAMWYYIRSHQK